MMGTLNSSGGGIPGRPATYVASKDTLCLLKVLVPPLCGSLRVVRCPSAVVNQEAYNWKTPQMSPDIPAVPN